jgi:tetratricopeptide (TPR) repeat protein
MKRWVSTLVIAAVFASLAWTGRWWKPWLLGLLDAQGARIQSLADLAQLALWVFAGLALIANFLRRKKPEAKPEQPSTRVEARDRSVAVGSNITDSNVITGNHNVVNQDSNVVNQPQQFRDLVMQQTVIQRSETTTLSPLHQLPPPPHDFTGRAQELTELLAATERGSVISGLQGLGGVGKTALALKLAERLKERCPDAQFYLDLRGVSQRPVTPAEAMAHVIHAYRPKDELPESEAELRPLFFSALHGQRALLVMDNAKDKAQVEPLIPPAGCVLLVTSRQHFTLPGMFDLNLDTLPRADAIKLLLNIAGCIGDQADEIARLCGDLPLALRVAAGALAERPNLTPADYARRLADAKQRLSHLKEVDVALNVSYEMLNEEQRLLWRALAVFPQTFDDAAAAVVWEMERDAAQDALGDLMKWSLVEFSDETRRYHLHDLARLFAEARLSEAKSRERKAMQKRFALHYRKVLETCQLLYLEGNESVRRGLALLDQESGNIQSRQSWAEARVEKDQEATLLCLDYSRIESDALDNLGHVWANIGRTLEIIEEYERHLSFTREVGDRESEGSALCRLSQAWALLCKGLKHIEVFEQQLTIAREIGDRRGEGSALWNIGLRVDNLGDRARATALAEAALTISEAIESPHAEKVRKQLAEWRGQAGPA